jgi:hypothetical protein
MARTNAMSFWDAVETLSDRGKPIVYPKQSVRSITFPVALISLITLAIAAVPLLLLDVDRVDGLPMLLSLFLFPMIAGALIIELVVLCKLGQQEPDWALLWWPLVVLPVGLLAMSLGPMLAHPDYFDVTGFSSGAGVMLVFTFLIVLGLGVGFLFWALVVFPLRVLCLAGFDAIRGDRVVAGRFYGPLVLLAIPAICVTVVLSLGDLEASRAVVGQFVLALLGIPGDYEVVSEPGLWIVRGIALALIGGAIWASMRNKKNDHKNKA